MGKIQTAITAAATQDRVARPIDRLKEMLSAQSVQEQFQNVLRENSGAFVASVIDLYNTDKTLQACDPKSVVMEALKAASLKLPINKSLGLAWIVPFKNKQGQYIPTFEIGYKGYLQMALRTGAYRFINGDVVYEGELTKRDKLTGEIDISGDRSGDKKIGYFAFLETLNGFRKTIYMSTEEVIAHARRFSQSFGSSYGPWTSDFDQMAIKTCFRALISKYGLMSVEMQSAFTQDSEMIKLADQAAQGEIPDDGAVIIEADATEVEVEETVI